MTPTAERLGFLGWLLSCAIFAYWFLWVAVSGLFGQRTDSGGNLVLYATGPNHTVYPFTYLAAGLSFVLLMFFIYRRERPKWDAIIIAPLAAYLSSVGMINVYEQVFLAGTFHATGGTYGYGVDWGSVNGALFSIFGISWLLASAPWWDRKNAQLAGALIGVFVVSILAWVAIGFPVVETGSPSVYFLNTVSRVTSQLIPVALVLPSGARSSLNSVVNRLRTLFRRYPAARAAEAHEVR